MFFFYLNGFIVLSSKKFVSLQGLDWKIWILHVCESLWRKCMHACVGGKELGVIFRLIWRMIQMCFAVIIIFTCCLFSSACNTYAVADTLSLISSFLSDHFELFRAECGFILLQHLHSSFPTGWLTFALNLLMKHTNRHTNLT